MNENGRTHGEMRSLPGNEIETVPRASNYENENQVAAPFQELEVIQS